MSRMNIYYFSISFFIWLSSSGSKKSTFNFLYVTLTWEIGKSSFHILRCWNPYVIYKLSNLFETKIHKSNCQHMIDIYFCCKICCSICEFRSPLFCRIFLWTADNHISLFRNGSIRIFRRKHINPIVIYFSFLSFLLIFSLFQSHMNTKWKNNAILLKI